ncbi:trypsin-1-like [Culicoides brevitarsis]|uniref:trypsin-1-like n=1 Tax=Culicoides brevitarsis TaxID=469753 RepID=UPI00307C83DB
MFPGNVLLVVLMRREEVTFSECPFIVAITSLFFELICGGTIVSSNYIVTAAHCLDDCPSLLVVAGEHDQTILHLSERVREVSLCHIHENYDRNFPYFNDIGLVKLTFPLIFEIYIPIFGVIADQYVKPVQLPVKDSEPFGYAMLFGWGSTSNTSEQSYPSILQKALLPIMSQMYCKFLYQEYFNGTGHICAGDYNKGQCFGDSGGPLVQDNTIVGIVAHGFTPCTSNGPGVLVKVSAYVDWINGKLST